MISFTDLFGYQRAKVVPAQAISDMQKEGAGFAGFAAWLDLTPAHPDMLAIPDPDSHCATSLETGNCLGCERLYHGRKPSRTGTAQCQKSKLPRLLRTT